MGACVLVLGLAGCPSTHRGQDLPDAEMSDAGRPATAEPPDPSTHAGDSGKGPGWKLPPAPDAGGLEEPFVVQHRRLDDTWSTTCALDREGRAHCWGTAAGKDPPPAEARFVSLKGEKWDGDAGNTMCGLTTEGRLRCWGSMTSRRGSAFDPARASEGRLVDFDLGPRAICAMREDRTFACWGEWVYGVLSDYHEKLAPADQSWDLAVNELAVGHGHVCALLPGGEVRCWGPAAEYGQQQVPRAKFARIAAADDWTCGSVAEANRVLCWGRHIWRDETEDEDVVLDLPARPARLWMDARSLAVVLEDGRLLRWGDFSEWELGPGERFREATRHCGVTVDDELVCMHDGDLSSLPPDGTRVRSALGMRCLQLEDGRLATPFDPRHPLDERARSCADGPGKDFGRLLSQSHGLCGTDRETGLGRCVRSDGSEVVIGDGRPWLDIAPDCILGADHVMRCVHDCYVITPEDGPPYCYYGQWSPKKAVWEVPDIVKLPRWVGNGGEMQLCGLDKAGRLRCGYQGRVVDTPPLQDAIVSAVSRGLDQVGQSVGCGIRRDDQRAYCWGLQIEPGEVRWASLDHLYYRDTAEGGGRLAMPFPAVACGRDLDGFVRCIGSHSWQPDPSWTTEPYAELLSIAAGVKARGGLCAIRLDRTLVCVGTALADTRPIDVSLPMRAR